VVQLEISLAPVTCQALGVKTIEKLLDLWRISGSSIKLRFGANELLKIIHAAITLLNPANISNCYIRTRRQPVPRRVNKICLVVSPAKLLLRGCNNNAIGRESLNELVVFCRKWRIARHVPNNDRPTAKAIWKFAHFGSAALLTANQCQAKKYGER
jgi:hypothetical protein